MRFFSFFFVSLLGSLSLSASASSSLFKEHVVPRWEFSSPKRLIPVKTIGCDAEERTYLFAKTALGQHTLVCLDQQGEPLWESLPINEEIKAFAADDKSRIYVGYGHALVCFLPNLQGSYTLSTAGGKCQSLALSSHLLRHFTCDGTKCRLSIFDIEGETAFLAEESFWEVDEEIVQAQFDDQGHLYLASESALMCVREEQPKTPLWCIESDPDLFTVSPQGEVYCAKTNPYLSTSHLYFIDEQGHQKWDLHLGGLIKSIAADAQGAVHCAATHSCLAKWSGIITPITGQISSKNAFSCFAFHRDQELLYQIGVEDLSKLSDSKTKNLFVDPYGNPYILIGHRLFHFHLASRRAESYLLGQMTRLTKKVENLRQKAARIQARIDEETEPSNAKVLKTVFTHFSSQRYKADFPLRPASPIAYDPQSLYAYFLADHTLFCFEAKTGALVWKEDDVIAFDRTFLQKDGQLYLSKTDGNIQLLSLQNKACLWETDISTFSSPPVTTAKNALYLLGKDGSLHCLPSSSAPTWQLPLEANSNFPLVPTPSGAIAFLSQDDSICCYNETQKKEWEVFLESPPASPLILGNDKRLYVVTQDHHLFHVDERGKAQSTFPLPLTTSFPPQIDEQGLIYFITPQDGAMELGCVDQKGKLKWVTKTRSESITPPVITQGGKQDTKVIFGSAAGYIWCFSHGTLEWKYKVEGKLEQAPTQSADGRIHFLSDEGVCYSFSTQDLQKSFSLWSMLFGG